MVRVKKGIQYFHKVVDLNFHSLNHGVKLFLCATTEPFRSKSFEDYLKGKRLEESTIESKLKLVKHLNSKGNLWDTDSIRKYIYEAKWGGRRKNNAGYA